MLAAVLGAALVVSGVGLIAPAGAQTTAPSLLNCATTSYRLLFWPTGHGVVKSQKFPEYKTPHVELYGGTGKRFEQTEYLAYVDATGANQRAATCAPGAITGSSGGAVPAANLVKSTKPTVLSCSAPSSSVLLVPNAQGKALLSVIVTGQSVAAASMAPTGSELQYDKSLCKPAKVPK